MCIYTSLLVIKFKREREELEWAGIFSDRKNAFNRYFVFIALRSPFIFFSLEFPWIFFIQFLSFTKYFAVIYNGNFLRAKVFRNVYYYYLFGNWKKWWWLRALTAILNKSGAKFAVGGEKKKDDWFDSYSYSMHWLKWENDRLFFLFFCFLIPWK